MLQHISSAGCWAARLQPGSKQVEVGSDAKGLNRIGAGARTGDSELAVWRDGEQGHETTPTAGVTQDSPDACGCRILGRGGSSGLLVLVDEAVAALAGGHRHAGFEQGGRRRVGWLLAE
jgi:hypothetical protein